MSARRSAFTPASEGWRFLSFTTIDLPDQGTWQISLADEEAALVPLRGRIRVALDGAERDIHRSDVFSELPTIAYLAPGGHVDATAVGDAGATFAFGSAPADGRYPTRWIEPEEIRVEVRGGGAARRQVSHVLAPPIAAERLILFEVLVPRGTWSGWPPHCHDGEDDSPYLEETYHFRFDRPEGFALHRNWREGVFDERFTACDGETVPVPRGYHSTVACPGANMFFLNYLAGELIGEERATPPCFHDAHTWIEADWSAGAWPDLPLTGT